MKIPLYDRRYLVDGAAAGPTAPGNAGAAAGEAAGAGIALNRLGQHMEEQAAESWAVREAADYRRARQQDLLDSQQNAPADGQGFADGFRGRSADDLAARLARAPNSRAASRLTDRASGIDAAFDGHALEFQTVQRARYVAGTLVPVLNSTVATVRADPGQLDAAFADYVSAVRASGLPPARQEEHLLRARATMAQAYGAALLDRQGPQALREAMTAHPLLRDGLDENNRDQLLARADAAERRNAGEARARVTAGYRDDVEAAAATGAGAGPGGAWRVSDAQLRAAHADNPAEAERLIEQRRAAARASLIDARLQGTTPAERAQMVQDARAGVGAAAEDGFGGALAASESGGNARARNAQGFVGLYQFGAARLAELGFYRPPAGEDLRANEWRGRFAIPGHPEVQTLQQFLDSPAAQRAAFAAHTAQIDRAIDEGGLLERFGGRTIGGAEIDRGALRAMAHLGGVAGMTRFLESNGAYDPADRNGTRLSAYAGRFAGSAADGLRPGVEARARLAELTAARAAHYEEQLRLRPGELAAQQPAIRALFAEADQDPAALQTAIATSLDWQRNAGVAEENLQPLPPAAAQAFARRFDQAATPRDRLALLQTLAGDDPAVAPRVLAQLRGAGGALAHRVPEAAGLVLEIAADPNRRATAEQLLSELSTPLRNLNDMAPGDRQTLAAAVDDAWSSRGGFFSGDPRFGGVLMGQAELTHNPAYAERAGMYRSAVEHIARVRGAAAGDVAAAARAAAADLSGHLAVVAEPDRALAHYPAWIAPPERMADGFDALRARIPELMAPFRPADDQRLAQQQFDRIVADTVARGVWVNDGGGFALTVPGTGAVLAVDGAPWRVFAHEVAAAGAAAPRAWNPESDRVERPR